MEKVMHLFRAGGNFLLIFCDTKTVCKMVIVGLLSHVRLCNPVTAVCQSSQSFANSQSLLKLMSIEFVMSSNHLILCGSFFSCVMN